MSIKFIRSGISTSIQDNGRFGWGFAGVPQSGFMDETMAQFTNLVVGNPKNTPLLEITRLGPQLTFSSPQRLAIGGCGIDASLNGEKVTCFEAFTVKKDDVLEIKRVTAGNYAYLSVFGGFAMENVLSSASMYNGITPQFRFKDGDVLETQQSKIQPSAKNATIHVDLARYLQAVIEVYPGPEFDLLKADDQKKLSSQSFTVTPNSNRMAFSFQERLSPNTNTMLTAPVVPGTIQLTSGGGIIALMKDAQVTGGYPRILQIAKDSMDVLAQKRPGEQIRLHLRRL